jgi:hypothetical protein
MNQGSPLVNATRRLAKVRFISRRLTGLFGSLIRDQAAKTTARGATAMIAAACNAVAGARRSTNNRRETRLRKLRSKEDGGPVRYI